MGAETSKSCIALLHAAALSLPGIAQAIEPPSEGQLRIGASRYDEADLSSSNLVFGDKSRYEIDVFQLGISAPINEEWLFTADVSHESMSGASPQASVPGLGGDPQLIMSGATIEDNRTAVNLSVGRYYSNWAWTIGFAHSDEDDYKSNGFDAALEIEVSDSWTLISTASFATDKVDPVEAVEFNRVTNETRRAVSATIAASKVINRSTAIQFGISYTKHSGFLSDPYKTQDVRPDSRHEWAASTRLRHYVENLNAALHVDYRYYDDSYGIEAHTVDLSWVQNVGPNWQLTPFVRYYAQDDADFFSFTNNFALPSQTPQSNDHRLAKFGSVSGGLAVSLTLPKSTITFDIEKYRAHEKYGLSSAAFNHPAALQYTRLSLTWAIRL